MPWETATGRLGTSRLVVCHTRRTALSFLYVLFHRHLAPSTGRPRIGGKNGEGGGGGSGQGGTLLTQVGT